MHSNSESTRAMPPLSLMISRMFVPPSFVAAILFGLVMPLQVRADKEANDTPKRATCVAVTEDGEFAVTSDDYGRLVKWRLSDLGDRQVFTRRHRKKAAYVSTAGTMAITAGYDGLVLVHDLNHPEAGNGTVFKGHESNDKKREVWVAVLSKDAKQAISGANDGQILQWDPKAKAPGKGRAFPYPEADEAKKKTKSEGPVAGLAFLPLVGKKQRILSTHGYGDVHLWEYNIEDNNDAVHLKTFSHGNSYQVNAVAVIGEGPEFVSAGFDKSLLLWNANDKVDHPQPVLPFQKVHKDWIWRVAVSREGNLVATASEDGFVLIWSVAAKKALGDLNIKPVPHGLMGVAFTKDNRLVLTLEGTEQDRLIRIDEPKF